MRQSIHTTIPSRSVLRRIPAGGGLLCSGKSGLAFFCSLLLLISIEAIGQTISPDSLQIKLENYRKRNLQEKLFVDFDQEVVLAGENLWFKMYCVDVFNHQYLPVSKVGYLEILDGDGKSVAQTMVALSNGGGSGVVRIPPVPTGTYHVQAYTLWMKNFPSDFFFHKNIGIINTLMTPDVSRNQPSDKVELDFFPEGGNLVNGITTRVAFRCHRPSGEGIAFKGYVLNSANDTVARIQPLKFGIGSFAFTPRPEMKYKAFVQIAGRQTQMFELPTASESGTSLRVVQSGSLVGVTVERRGTSDKGGFLIVHSHQKVAYASSFLFRDDRAEITLGKDRLREGISSVTVFDDTMRPVAERLIFKQPGEGIELSLMTDQQVYGTRKKVTLEVSMKGDASASDSAALSLAVVKAYPGLAEPSVDVRNFLWLTSDLAGNIESPEYYLGPEAEVAPAADNLMMTHGWRRFNWKEVSARVPAPLKFLPEYNGHLVRARVTDSLGKPVRSVLTYLSSPGRASRIYPAFTDVNGEARYETRHLTGRKSIVLQVDPARDSTLKISLISPFSNSVQALKLPPLTLQPSLRSSLRERSIAMQVQQLYEAKELSEEKGDSSNFFGPGSETYRLDDYIRFPLMEEVMREYVKGIWVRRKSDGFHFQVHDNLQHKVFNDRPLVLMDGVPVFNVNRIMQYDPLLVSRLELVTSKYYLGPVTFYGVVSYHTYKGDLRNFQLDPSSVVIDYEALQQHREFFAPDYGKSRAQRKPDQRTVLAWLPTVWCPAGQKRKIEFYTSDLTGKFIVVAEGISVSGQSGGGKSTFEVQPEP